MFGWDFNAWSRFWNWNLIKICVISCNMNLTLGSVVPLAMFPHETVPYWPITIPIALIHCKQVSKPYFAYALTYGDDDDDDDDDYGGGDWRLSKKLTNENVQESDFVSKACCYVQSIRMDCDAGKDCNKSRITSSSELEPTWKAPPWTFWRVPCLWSDSSRLGWFGPLNRSPQVVSWRWWC